METPEGIADLFYEIYPEFLDVVPPERVEAAAKRVYLLYKVLDKGSNEELRLAACMAIAHYLARSSTVIGEGEINGGISGVASSASVGGVSVSLQGKPVSDMNEDFFASTQYGQEFMAWLDSLGGVYYVN